MSVSRMLHMIASDPNISREFQEAIMPKTDAGEHTPGPWSCRFCLSEGDPALGLKPVRALSNDGGIAIMAEDKRIAVADCQSRFKRGQGHNAECAERDANARLIEVDQGEGSVYTIAPAVVAGRHHPVSL